MDRVPKLPISIAEIYESYETDGTHLVEAGMIYACLVREIIDHGYLKKRRIRDKALAPGKRHNRTDADRQAGKRKWDEIYHSMKEHGYNSSKPVEFRIKRSNQKRNLHQGHHRITIADELGIQEVAVVFKFIPGS